MSTWARPAPSVETTPPNGMEGQASHLRCEPITGLSRKEREAKPPIFRDHCAFAPRLSRLLGEFLHVFDGVGFVDDLDAEEGFEDVFEGDDAYLAAVLVDDDEQVVARSMNCWRTVESLADSGTMWAGRAISSSVAS